MPETLGSELRKARIAAGMTLRAVQVVLVHWKRGYSVLERPETSIEDR